MGFGRLLIGVQQFQMMKIKITNYNEKATKAFSLFCVHLTDAELTDVQYCENVKSAWETLWSVHQAKIIGNQLFL